MDVFFFSRALIKRQIVQNLIQAGKENHETAEQCLDTLDLLDSKDLLAVLLESSLAAEEAMPGIPANYLIDRRSICSN